MITELDFAPPPHIAKWRRIVSRGMARSARRKHAFTAQHQDMAMDWVTCPAGGFPTTFIPRRSDGYAPADARLFKLGGEFGDAVWSGNATRAALILGRIEARAATIVMKSLGYEVAA